MQILVYQLLSKYNYKPTDYYFVIFFIILIMDSVVNSCILCSTTSVYIIGSHYEVTQSYTFICNMKNLKNKTFLNSSYKEMICLKQSLSMITWVFIL